MPGACTWFSRTRGSGGSTPKGIVLADRRFEYRQGRRRLGTVQEQPLWQRKPLEQTARSPSPASVHQLNVVVVTWAARAKAWVMKVAANSPFGADHGLPGSYVFTFSGGLRRRCPEVGLGEIAIDLLQARFWIASVSPTNHPGSLDSSPMYCATIITHTHGHHLWHATESP
jgi:hypothetical protein